MAPHDRINRIEHSSSKPRYDQSTFIGRLQHFLKVTDPRTLLVSDERLEKSKKILQDYEKEHRIPAGGAEALWDAQNDVNAIIHPTTGQKILAPFRMSAFVPANILIAAGLLIPGAGMATQVFWQFVNQSYNTAMNYANRNGTDAEASTQELLTNFAYAVGVSSSLSMGFRASFERASFMSDATRNVAKLFVPFFTVAGSNLANVVLMRRGEIQNGVQVTDEDGNVRGKSVVAGRYGLTQVAISRVLIPVPVLTIPPIAFHFLNKTKFMAHNPIMAIPVNLTLIATCLYMGLPPAIALFPQIGAIDVSKLEPEFQGLLNAKGKPISTLYYNKGL